MTCHVSSHGVVMSLTQLSRASNVSTLLQRDVLAACIACAHRHYFRCALGGGGRPLTRLRCQHDVGEATTEVGADVAVDDRVHARVGVGEAVREHAVDLVPASSRLDAAVGDEQVDVQRQPADGKHDDDDDEHTGDVRRTTTHHRRLTAPH